MIRRTLSMVLLVAGCAACGDVPQPFRHEGTPDSLARPKLTRGVTVRPPAGVDNAQAVAEALVRALGEQDVPAMVHEGPAFGHVPAFGYVIESSADDLGTSMGVRWTLKTPEGEAAASNTQTIPKLILTKADPKQMTRLAANAAAILARPLADPDALPQKNTGPDAVDNRIPVSVTPLRGLPGDGDKAMTTALKRALERSGLVVKDDGAAYMVEGKITVAPGLPGEDTVTVAWILKRVEGDAQLANIGQSGAVPRGKLSGPWGSLARDIAEGGASGLLEVIRADTGTAKRTQGGLQK
ncbi:MAG: hypothetical protein H7Z12_16495 [Rhodospirillaceae bacterium]|nr:hypothetical protein [Rhodospirillales bacterium]